MFVSLYMQDMQDMQMLFYGCVERPSVNYALFKIQN